jgi:membrane-bound lytic murein transglycosylase F
MLRLFLQSFIFVLLLSNSSCIHNSADQKPYSTLSEIKKRGKLRIVTLNSSTSYFLYKGQAMGYEYELASSFAESIGVEPEVIVAENENRLTQIMLEGKADVVAYSMPITNELKDSVLYCGKQTITHQVLVQQKIPQNPILRDVTQLIGKKVFVRQDTRYYDRLVNLNQELGGGIKIYLIKKDSLSPEDLIEMVSDGKIPYTVAANNVAQLNKTYFENIDVSLKISFPQRLSWMVDKENATLAKALDSWFATSLKTVEYATLSKRYFEQSKRAWVLPIPQITKGRISPYDDLFKKYARELDFDWRLLAALAFIESRFDPTQISWAGAKGLMQLMPRTAASVGIYGKEIYDPETNIRGAVKSIRILKRLYSSIPNDTERMKFIIGAYNSGIGHIMDAQALAQKHGKSKVLWENNVSTYLILKNRSEFYNDNVCHSGYLRVEETCLYVKKVMFTYQFYVSKTKK